MRELEAQRLRELILAWLVVERERAPFQVLKLEARGPGEAQTGEAVREFEGLRLRLRPDRVDVDERGQRIVLDYKTGVRKPAPWTGGRSEEHTSELQSLMRIFYAVLCLKKNNNLIFFDY